MAYTTCDTKLFIFRTDKLKGSIEKVKSDVVLLRVKPLYHESHNTWRAILLNVTASETGCISECLWQILWFKSITALLLFYFLYLNLASGTRMMNLTESTHSNVFFVVDVRKVSLLAISLCDGYRLFVIRISVCI